MFTFMIVTVHSRSLFGKMPSGKDSRSKDRKYYRHQDGGRHRSPGRSLSRESEDSRDRHRDYSRRARDDSNDSRQQSGRRHHDGESVRSRSRHRSVSVASRIYDSFQGGFVPREVFEDVRDIPLPPLPKDNPPPPPPPPPHPRHSSPFRGDPRVHSTESGIAPMNSSGVSRTLRTSAQITAPPSGSQAFSDEQLRQLRSMFDAYHSASSTGEYSIGA